MGKCQKYIAPFLTDFIYVFFGTNPSIYNAQKIIKLASQTSIKSSIFPYLYYHSIAFSLFRVIMVFVLLRKFICLCYPFPSQIVAYSLISWGFFAIFSRKMYLFSRPSLTCDNKHDIYYFNNSQGIKWMTVWIKKIHYFSNQNILNS